MGKYIIESKFENTRCFLEVACENREPYFFINRVDSLTPYTEPNLEQVRKESFKNGYDAACKDIDIKSKTNAAYQKGLSDAWEAAKKIQDTGGNLNWWIHHVSASEVIEKIRQYEQGKEKIKVGDELTDGTYTAVVTKITDYGDKPIYQAISFDGEVYEDFDDGHKTGRHFTEIAEVLQKMKETNNG